MAVLYDIGEVNFVIDMAISLRLVIKEIATQSLKHAFTGNQKGVISIRLSRDSIGSIVPAMIDHGAGMSLEFDADMTPSFGINITFGIIGVKAHGSVVGKAAAESLIG